MSLYCWSLVPLRLLVLCGIRRALWIMSYFFAGLFSWPRSSEGLVVAHWTRSVLNGVLP